eukprot:14739139-Alexandrium_andersonii.AAC.1
MAAAIRVCRVKKISNKNGRPPARPRPSIDDSFGESTRRRRVAPRVCESKAVFGLSIDYSFA